MRFVNRRDEIAALGHWWEQRYPRPALAWGRRRVGKTALLQHFADVHLADHPVVFHTGTGSPAPAELDQLSRQVSQVLPDDLRDLRAHPYRDWREALDHLGAAARDAPLLLVLDEFPELIATSPDLPGIIRAFLDRTLGRTQLRLLLCGSAVRTMRGLQEERAPLYGRFDLNLQVHPFRPHEAAAMLPDLPPAERARVYGIVGGMPLYLSWWDGRAPLSANLRRLACRPGAPLLTEGQLVLATEAEGGGYPAAVLHAIAAGKTRHNEIADQIRAEPARTLDRLIELRLVERILPVTETGRTRRRIYRIADNFLAFYLGLLSRHRGEIERGLGDSILPVLVNGLDDHLGPVYEESLRDHLRREAAAGRLRPEVVAVGPWWRDDGGDEIDAVVLAGRSRTPVLVGEAKWARTVDAARVRHQLERKAAALGADPDRLEYLVCARDEVVNVPPGTVTVTSEDIFALPDGSG